MTIVGELAAANGGRLVLADAAPHGLSARIEFRIFASPFPEGVPGGMPVPSVSCPAPGPSRRSVLKSAIAVGLTACLPPAPQRLYSG